MAALVPAIHAVFFPIHLAAAATLINRSIDSEFQSIV
jgi:hypothetical protein